MGGSDWLINRVVVNSGFIALTIGLICDRFLVFDDLCRLLTVWLIETLGLID